MRSLTIHIFSLITNMSKRHSDDYYKPGSAKSSRKEVQNDETKQTSRSCDKSSSDGEEYDEFKKYKTTKETLKIVATKTKLEFPKKKVTPGIQIKLGLPKKATETKQKISVASVFNQDSDDEPEEMPREARMKMRNIGRDTPTSAGPNSFGKTKQGFCHAKRVFEKSVEQALEGLKD